MNDPIPLHTGLAVCAALGVEYWSPGPYRTSVWAVNPDGRAVAIKVRKRPDGEVQAAVVGWPVAPGSTAHALPANQSKSLDWQAVAV